MVASDQIHHLVIEAIMAIHDGMLEEGMNLTDLTPVRAEEAAVAAFRAGIELGRLDDQDYDDFRQAFRFHLLSGIEHLNAFQREWD